MADDLTNLWGNFSLVEEEEDELEIMAPDMAGLTQRGDVTPPHIFFLSHK
jgi:hypothetical protein